MSSFGGSVFRQMRDFRNSDPFSSKHFLCHCGVFCTSSGSCSVYVRVCSFIHREDLEKEIMSWDSHEGAEIAAGPCGPWVAEVEIEGVEAWVKSGCQDRLEGKRAGFGDSGWGLCLAKVWPGSTPPLLPKVLRGKREGYGSNILLEQTGEDFECHLIYLHCKKLRRLSSWGQLVRGGYLLKFRPASIHIGINCPEERQEIGDPDSGD